MSACACGESCRDGKASSPENQGLSLEKGCLLIRRPCFATRENFLSQIEPVKQAYRAGCPGWMCRMQNSRHRCISCSPARTSPPDWEFSSVIKCRNVFSGTSTVPMGQDRGPRQTDPLNFEAAGIIGYGDGSDRKHIETTPRL
jgi:hypothetical protein